MPWRFERLAAMVAAGCLCADASAATAWHLSRTEHFELYSQSDDSAARPLLIWFEQLRAFFLQQSVVRAHDLPPVRLVVFASQAEYEQYRLRATSDAYFAAFGNREYIAMPSGTSSEPRIAAHEFAHFVLHSAGMQLPAWLNEGLCEFFSTVRIAESASELGGEVRASSQALKRQSWMPIRELLALAADSPVREDRQSAGMFYAQSWALTQMLVLSPDYGPRFQELLAAIGRGSTSADALGAVYGVSAETMESDLRAWVGSATSRTLRLPGVVAEAGRVEVSDVPSYTSGLMLADLLAASGELDRAEALYRELAREIPQSADVAAALGAIALRKGNIPGARVEWKRAIEQGVADADVCYRCRHGGLAAQIEAPDVVVLMVTVCADA